jgi:site-specific DNA recombinase
VVWNRTRKVRDPRTGRRVQRLRPQSEWKIQEAPHLRIVSEELWTAVQQRLSSVKTAFANGESAGLCNRAYSAPYLLSGFLKCGVCGSKMVVVSGRGNSGRARYGCPLKHARGICTNSLHVRQDHLEKEVIEGLQREVLQEDAVRYALAKFKAELSERLNNTRSHLAVLRDERDRLKDEISNLAAVIASGRHSPALLAELEKREHRLEEISDELLATDGRGIDAWPPPNEPHKISLQ